jgi:hypothetical protein
MKFIALSLLCLVGVALGQSTQGLPRRELVITGGQFTSESYIDVGAFTAPVFPLDDREWIGTPQLSFLCYSPRVSLDKFHLFTHMKDVVYPIIWYYPLDHKLGEWKYDYGDTLICQLWECDGAADGCDPKKPSVLPNAKAGDDLLGQASLSMGSYQILASHLLNMTVPANGKGKYGDQAASFLIECKGCKNLWSQDPSWVNPFTEVMPEEKQPDPSKQVDTPPVTVERPQSSPALPWRSPSQPSPSPPPEKPKEEDATPVEPFEGPVTPTDVKPDGSSDPTDDSSSGGGSNILAIVLAVLGALVGILVIAVIAFFVMKKCGWRKVEPLEPEDSIQNAKDENVARHLRIRVQRPAEADQAIQQHRVDGAMAELPWAPKTKH